MRTLTSNQERYLFAEMSSAYSFWIGVWYEIPGKLDPGRLKAAINAALSRHTGCRTRFQRAADGDYLAVVEQDAGFAFHVLPVSEINAETIEAAVAPYLKKLQRFDSLADFHRFFLLDTGLGRQAFVLCQHHAVSDGRSLDLVSSEIAQLYSDPDAALPAALAFHDVALNATALPEDTAFWQKTMEGIEDVPRFHRNLAVPPPPQPRRIGWAPEVGAARTFPNAVPGVKPFSVLAAGFAAQIAAQTRQSDVVFSIQSAGRHGFNDAIVTGSFSNALPIRTQVDPEEPFSGLAKRLQQSIRDALQHERLGYHRIQQLTGVRPDFALNLYPTAPVLQFGTLAAGPRRFLTSESDYGVNIRWQRDDAGNPNVDAYFDATTVEPDRIAAFLERTVAIVSASSAAPQDRVFELLNAARIETPNQTPPGLHKKVTLQRLFSLFRAGAADHPTKTAIQFDGQAIRYADLAVLVEDRATRLHAEGVGAGMKVGFLASRNPDFVIDMLALSRLGAAFAAFDTEYPLPRLIELFNSLQCDFVISSQAGQQSFLDGLRVAGARTVDVTAMATAAADCPAVPEPASPGADEIAYYLFTSGTTGTPKAIGVGHEALPQFLAWQAKTFDVGPDDCVTMMSGLAHDPVLRDVFLPLLHGAALTIPSQDTLRNPRELESWLQQQRPSIVHTTPPMGQLLCDITAGKPILSGTRLVFWGGDMLPGELVRKITEANPNLQQVNFYGATETPQAALYYLHDSAQPPLKTLPIGKPVAGVLADVMGPHSQPLDVNELGEVRIRSPYLVQISGQRSTTSDTGQVYDTGDLGYRRPDGAIQLVGRQDDQVSVRGYRVELSDVERHLAQIEGVTAACVLSEKDAQGRTFLFAHIVTDPASGLDSTGLRKSMQASVPTYMVPTFILLHERLPLLPNGKRNRAALRILQKTFQQDQASADIDTPTAGVLDFSAGERAVLGIFEKTTGLKVDHKDQSFVEIGADSLNYIQALLRLEPIIPDLPTDWQDMSVAELGRMVRATSDSRGARWTGLFRPVQAEFPVLLRAIAILAIVALHLKVGSLGGGGTFILFMLMGYSIFRFQLPRVLSDESIKGFLNPLVTVVIATVLVSLLLWAAKAMQGEPFSLAGLFFVTNFLDFSKDGAASGGIIWLWFIACYVQIMLLCAVFLALPAVRAVLKQNVPRAVTGIFLGSAIVKFGLIGLVNPEMLTSGVPLLNHWNYVPITHFPTVMLGGIVCLAASGAYSRTLCMALTILYALAVGAVFDANQPLLFVAGVALIVFARSVPMPFILYWVFMQISAASLYIYLLHSPAFSFLRMAGLDLPPIGFYILIIFGSVGFSVLLRAKLQPTPG